MREMATNNCHMSYLEWEPAVYIPIATLTMLVGGLDIALAVYMKLHKKMLYRLVMYQVLVGTVYGVFWLLNLVRNESSWPVQNIVFRSLLLFAAGVKLLLGVSLTVQIYILAVIQRNFPKLELIYVTASLLVSLALAVAYGAVYYKNIYQCDGRIMQHIYLNLTVFALSAVLLAAACMCSLTVLLLVARRIFRGRRMLNSSYIERQHMKAACEMLPLFSYLLIFLAHILVVFILLFFIDVEWHYEDKRTTRALTALESSWGLVASFTFAIHLAVVMWVRKCCVKASIASHKQQYGTIDDTV